MNSKKIENNGQVWFDPDEFAKASEITQVGSDIGTMSELDTDADTLVGAINEVKNQFPFSVVNGAFCVTYNT